MKSINQILKAAQDTSDYMNLMRMPKRKESFTNYASLDFSTGTPVLKEKGFQMLSPGQVREDSWFSIGSIYTFLPLTTGLGIINGMNATTKSGKVFNYSSSVLSLVSLGYYINRRRKVNKASTLVFPKVR